MRANRDFCLLLIVVYPVPSTDLHMEQVPSKYLYSERVDRYSHFVNEDLESWEG